MTHFSESYMVFHDICCPFRHLNDLLVHWRWIRIETICLIGCHLGTNGFKPIVILINILFIGCFEWLSNLIALRRHLLRISPLIKDFPLFSLSLSLSIALSVLCSCRRRFHTPLKKSQIFCFTFYKLYRRERIIM